MTHIHNNPADFADESLAGLLAANREKVRGVFGGLVVRATRAPQVAVVVGGGAGHYPTCAGLVGDGFATGAVVGNIFTSPSSAHVYSVAKAANQGHGIVLAIGNYAGDRINFAIAADRLRAEGIDTRLVTATDDIASSTQMQERRGVAGCFAVYKAMGAAAAEGRPIDEVERAGLAANAAVRTLGVGFDGCTLPGAERTLFSLPDGVLGVGLGIHGEPSIREQRSGTSAELAALLVDAVVADAPPGAGTRVAPIVNGLGSTKYEELYVLWNDIAALLESLEYELVQPEVGEFVTSLDMGGCSLSLMWLDEDLERWWRAPADAIGFRRYGTRAVELTEPTGAPGSSSVGPERSAGPASAEDLAAVDVIQSGLADMLATVRAGEARWGELDARAGDGDHGRGMRRGAEAAVSAASAAITSGAGASGTLRQAGTAWADQAGGTSGVLWGAALQAAANVLAGARGKTSIADVVDAFVRAIQELGGARIGDKTIVDAAAPFAAALREGLDKSLSAADAWKSAANIALVSAEATSGLVARVGRAKPLAERSIGVADPGATSFAEIVAAVIERHVRDV